MAGFTKLEQNYLNTLSRLYPKKLMNNTEIVSAIENYRIDKDQKILNKIINNFIRLLIKTARKYKKSEIDVGDLVHYGIDGLIEAIAYSFKLDSKNKFITYITLIIERRMKDGLDECRGTIRLPKHKMVEQRKAKHLKHDNPNNLKIGDIYSKFNIGKHSEFSSIIAKNLPGKYEESIEKSLDKESLNFDISRVLTNLLTKIEVEIISSYYGLNGDIERPYESISHTMSIPIIKVKKILHRAVNKLKKDRNSLDILQKYLM